MKLAHLLMTLSLSGGVVVYGSPTFAQQRTFTDAARAAKDLTLGGVTPFAGLSQRRASSSSWSVNGIYAFRELEASQGTRRRMGILYYIVRRESGGLATEASTQWADSRTCPGVGTMLLTMEDLSPVRVDVPGLGREWELILTLDGVDHIFWTRSARSGPNYAPVDLEISGNLNSPVAIWWETAAEGLKDCWFSAPPQGLAQGRQALAVAGER